MKTVTVRQVQTKLGDILRLVAQGESVQVMDKKKAVARISPPSENGEHIDWSKTWSKVDAIFGNKPLRGKPGSRIIIEGRR